MNESPTQEAENLFDHALDDATHAVMDYFAWMGLPEGEQLVRLKESVNDALAPILREWL
jgi:hypothetical protein